MYRQTFLPFKPLARGPDASLSKTRAATAPRSALEVPPEIWHEIFLCLKQSTLTIKSFRLVCLYWAQVGLQRLFSTVYLDSFEASWIRLLALCRSPYATLVRKIVWNPLVLYSDCLDAAVWRTHYPNLLRGVRHYDLLRLHEAFCRTYKREEKRRPLPESFLKSCTGMLSNLRNCSDVIVNDDLDFETACFEVGIKGLLGDESTSWDKAPLWARNPRLVDVVPSLPSEELLPTITTNVLELITNVHSIRSVEIRLWDMKFRELLSGSFSNWVNTNVTALYLELKTCHSGVEVVSDCLGYADSQLIYSPTGLVSKFSKLRSIHLGTVYADPGSGLLKFIRDILPDDLEESDDNASIVLARGFQEIVDLKDRPLGFSAEMISACHYSVDIPLHLPDTLSQITLSNGTVDLRLLLFSLIDLPQLPTRPLTLHFSGCTILYGLDQDIFLATLATLGIQLICDENTAFHCRSTSYLGYYDDLYGYEPPELGYSKSNYSLRAREYHNFLRQLNDAELPCLLWKSEWDQRTSESVSASHVKIMEKPQEYSNLCKEHMNNRRCRDAATYVYGCSKRSRVNDKGNSSVHFSYKWSETRRSLANGRVAEKPPPSHPFVSLHLFALCDSWDMDFGACYACYPTHYLDINGERLLCNDFAEDLHAKLTRYETELLGLDLI